MLLLLSGVRIASATTMNATGSGGPLNIVNGDRGCVFNLGDSPEGGGHPTDWNVVGSGGGDTFNLMGTGESDSWTVSGVGNDLFNVTTGGGDGRFNLVSGNAAGFEIFVNGNGSLSFHIHAGAGSTLVGYSRSQGSVGGFGDETWNLDFGPNSTMSLPSLEGSEVYNVNLDATGKGSLSVMSLAQTSFPVMVGFTVRANQSISSFSWHFGDGSESSEASPTHYFASPSVYNVTVRVKDASGHISSATLLLGAFKSVGETEGAIAVIPESGNPDISQVSVIGLRFVPASKVGVLMNDTEVGVVTADRFGHFSFNVTGALDDSSTNGLLVFTTDPDSTDAMFFLQAATALPPPPGWGNSTATGPNGDRPADGLTAVGPSLWWLVALALVGGAIYGGLRRRNNV